MTYYDFISRFTAIDFEGNINVRIAFDNILEEDTLKGDIRSYIENWSLNCMTLNEAKRMCSLYFEEVTGYCILIDEGELFLDIELILPFEIYERAFKLDFSEDEANEMYEEYVFRCIDNRKRIDKKFSSTYIK